MNKRTDRQTDGYHGQNPVLQQGINNLIAQYKYDFKQNNLFTEECVEFLYQDTVCH